MDTLTYLRAETLPLEQVVETFNRSFEGYFVPMTHTVDSLRTLVLVNDVSLAHSFVAMDTQGRPAGIVLLGIRGTRGWVGGMGIVPEWRGQGQATPLMHVALEEARSLGLASVGLEVLTQNTPARRLYQRLGFEDIRSLAVFTGPLADGPAAIDESLPMREIPIEQALADFAALHQVPSPWQRDLPALEHMASMLRVLALMPNETADAALVYMPSGMGYSIMDFGSRAATPDARRNDAIALVSTLVAAIPAAPIRAINVPPGDALGDALTTLGCPTPHMQWEMKLELG